MTTLRSIISTQVRLLWRRPAFWIVQALLLLPMVMVFVGHFFFQPQADISGVNLVTGQLSTFLVLLLLLLPVLTAPEITRDVGKSGEILWTTPLDAATHLAGTWIGLWVGMLPVVLLQLAAWSLYGLITPGYRIDAAWLYGLPMALVGMTLDLSLVTLAALLVRRTLVLMLFWIPLWAMTIIGLIGLDNFNALEENSLYNLFFFNLRLSSTTGLGLNRSMVLSMAAWFLGASLLALCLACALTLAADKRRASRRGRWVLGAGLAAAIVMGGAYLVNARATLEHAILLSPGYNQQDFWNIKDLQMEVTIDPARGSLAGQSTLQLESTTSGSPQLVVLRLNPGLQLTMATLPPGQPLQASREGDSLVLTLPEIVSNPLVLNLTWQGQLNIAYVDFNKTEFNVDMPTLPFDDPTKLKAVLVRGMGYLLRDGDWYPYPWVTGAQQPGRSHVTLRLAPASDNALPSLQNGAVTYAGPLPPALLVLPPGRIQVVGETSYYFGNLAGTRLMERTFQAASAAQKLAGLLGEPAPRQVVSLPYLNELIWSGDLLLVPDASAYYTSPALAYAFNDIRAAFPANLVERTLIAALARSWIYDRNQINGGRFTPVNFWGMETSLVSWRSPTYLTYLQTTGLNASSSRYMRRPEIMDTLYSWPARRTESITAAGQFAAVGMWMAIELADPQVRQADIDGLTLMISNSGTMPIHERQLLKSDRAWPFVMDSYGGRLEVYQLLQWAEQVGPQKALGLAAAALREKSYQRIQDLFADLEAASGVAIIP